MKKKIVLYPAFLSLFMLSSGYPLPETLSFLGVCINQNAIFEDLPQASPSNSRSIFWCPLLSPFSQPTMCSVHWPSRAFCSLLMACNIQGCWWWCLFLSLLLLQVEFIYYPKRLQTTFSVSLCLLVQCHSHYKCSVNTCGVELAFGV